MARDPATVSERRYRAFISYSHRDEAWAVWLHKALEAYRVPSRLVGLETALGKVPHRLTPIFRDREELASAHDLNGKVAEALVQSESLIVICSPQSAVSHWVDEEVLAYRPRSVLPQPCAMASMPTAGPATIRQNRSPPMRVPAWTEKPMPNSS